MSISVTIWLEINGEDKLCDVKVWEEAEEKGYGECPDYPYRCGIETIECDGASVSVDYGSEQDLDELALQISKGEYKDSMETKASNKYDEQQVEH